MERKEILCKGKVDRSQKGVLKKTEFLRTNKKIGRIEWMVLLTKDK